MELTPEAAKYVTHPEWPHITAMRLQVLADIGLIETVEVRPINEVGVSDGDIRDRTEAA